MRRRGFLAGAALAASLPLVAAARPSRPASPAPRRRLPPALKPGDTIGLVSPSSASDERLSLQLAREVIEALGFKVKEGRHAASRRGYLAGTDAERAGDLNAMFADPGVDGIV